jgi:fluoroquinolone transport system ATP-binding protein
MIEVKDLTFSYNQKEFIKDIHFQVEKGMIFGFLGPSGAGKSTLQKILTGLITNYKGHAIVNGVECKNHTNAFYENIGVDFEFPTLYEKLTARENLEFFASLYSQPTQSIDQLLESVGLQNDAHKKVRDYSKGMKSRLNFIKSLLNDPDVLFLDEPTSGLDPTNSRIMKDLILDEKRKGKTIILTTHNMEDATELCDQVAFIMNGQICAMDSPQNLIMSHGAAQIVYTYEEEGLQQRTCPLDKLSFDTKLNELIRENQLLSIHSSEPTLNDIFMEVTGRTLL